MRQLEPFRRDGGGPMRVGTSVAGGSSFDCPKCGAHGEEITIAIDTDLVETRPLVELWEGGPVVEDIGALPEMRPGDKTLTTSACSCSFLLSPHDWTMAVEVYPDNHGVLLLTSNRADGAVTT